MQYQPETPTMDRMQLSPMLQTHYFLERLLLILQSPRPLGRSMQMAGQESLQVQGGVHQS